ncbi:MAG: hypothetical protein JOZ05_05490, partial [Acetobacteraceae bacterium]|nr:hypothetical protein [Acetobacteraceae bacterium]
MTAVDRTLLPTALALLILPVAVGARAQPVAQDPAAVCQRAVVDDTLRPVPDGLVPAARQLFGLRNMPANAVRRTTVFRCMQGAVMLCNFGANLPCGKANSARDLPAAEAWCRQRPGDLMIPMVVTGHDTLYRW